MFKQGEKPAIVASESDLGDIIAMLLAAGYKTHKGMRIKRRREALTLKKSYQSKNEPHQCHVQIVIKKDGELKVFAHTEPDTKDILVHGVAAFFDQANYENGCRMLRRDLEKGAKILSLGKKKRSKR